MVWYAADLYACGKVCLSLLGTWAGGQGEGWNPDVSTAFQVGQPDSLLISKHTCLTLQESNANGSSWTCHSSGTAALVLSTQGVVLGKTTIAHDS